MSHPEGSPVASRLPPAIAPLCALVVWIITLLVRSPDIFVDVPRFLGQGAALLALLLLGSLVSNAVQGKRMLVQVGVLTICLALSILLPVAIARVQYPPAAPGAVRYGTTVKAVAFRQVAENGGAPAEGKAWQRVKTDSGIYWFELGSVRLVVGETSLPMPSYVFREVRIESVEGQPHLSLFDDARQMWFYFPLGRIGPVLYFNDEGQRIATDFLVTASSVPITSDPSR